MFRYQLGIRNLQPLSSVVIVNTHPSRINWLTTTLRRDINVPFSVINVPPKYFCSLISNSFISRLARTYRLDWWLYPLAAWATSSAGGRNSYPKGQFIFCR
jgi:hypothetical protein